MSSIAEQVMKGLETCLGPYNACVAVKVFSQRALGRAPETLTHRDLPALLEALRPMLKTLIGEAAAQSLLDTLRKEVKE